MSAIAGIYNLSGEPIQPEWQQILIHDWFPFPADDIQSWHQENLFFACCSQWITPESVGEELPYYDSGRRLAITADAILDNRQELFDRLQIDYAERAGMPDSRLILLAYERWKEDTPKYLLGDFAFVIWDERSKVLFGARDFSGCRTLYYTRSQGRFAFSTTLRPLLNLPYINKKLNEQWLAEYLAISGSIDVIDMGATVYENVEQLPPSHSIQVSADGVKLTRYCTLSPGKPLRLKSDEEYIEAFREVFNQAVSSRTRTYRGVGAHLSGGLDSGSIVGFAARMLKERNKQLHTFSYIPSKDFKDYTPKYLMPDERPYIQSTIDYIGGIQAHYLDFDGRNSLDEVDGMLDMMEMPYKFFENSFWLRGIFESAQQERMGVLLNGARGNLSISWGSALSYYALLLKRLQWIKLANELHQYSHKVGTARFRSLPLIARTAFPVMDRFFPEETTYRFPTLINPSFAERSKVFDKLREHGLDESGWYSGAGMHELRKKHYGELFHWNATNTLSTKLSLRYSLRYADPTNDLRVIRFCLSLPDEQYVKNGMDRALIRRSTESVLPDKIRLNQRVRGVQGADWVHRLIPSWKLLTEELRHLRSDRTVMDYLDSSVVNRAIDKMSSNVRPEMATDPDYRIAMRSLIFYRFIKQAT
ncbi:lasso peptide isopeptide bond-forming cyclase [Paenibacillus aurantius]|uniref:asparagine synthase (glutamine-hydrolyzing) n=1 Tax=Paenibacillus aurantius TaxID=2918900 RepID=A0AA96LJL2_9BACL|nr:lasso peptide isopeptide bond-forming cyclase [Paenibacillus aurantius]WNQ12677.1 lasso peptide isopeptide bond-forming cyclase [Paenibacillus aurantius]